MKRAALALGIAGLLWGLPALPGLVSLRAEAPPESLQAAARIEAIPAGDVRLTLYALNPERVDFPDDRKAGEFHGFPVLGQAAISSARERKTLLDALAAAARAGDGAGTKCFNPRHGLRVESASGTVDFVICFQCRLVSVYGGNPMNLFLIGGPSDAFDRALKAHGLRKAD